MQSRFIRKNKEEPPPNPRHMEGQGAVPIKHYPTIN